MKKEILFYKKVMDNHFPEGTTHRLRKQLKFIGRNLFYYSKAKKIANFIIEHPYLSKVVYKRFILCSTLHKPYMTYDLSTQEKIKISISSYKYLDNFFTKKTLDILYEKGNIKILEIAGKSGKTLSVYFRMFTNFDKEGEFNLDLYQDKSLLSTTTFAIWNNSIFIGGLQGLPRNNKDPDILKRITKDFYGVFPKKLLIEVFYNLFSEDKIAVGNSKHIYKALRYKFKKWLVIQADYDEFWASLGSIKRKDGLWELPKKITRKALEEVPSKKRSQYRNRYEILDKLETLVLDFKTNHCLK